MPGIPVLSPSLLLHLHSVRIAPGAQNSGGPGGMGVEWDSKWAPGECVHLLWLGKMGEGLLMSQVASLLFAFNAETNHQGTVSYPLLFMLFPLFTNYECWEWRYRRKGKDRAVPGYFSFQPSLLIINSKTESGGQTCVRQEVKLKRFAEFCAFPVFV